MKFRVLFTISIFFAVFSSTVFSKDLIIDSKVLIRNYRITEFLTSSESINFEINSKVAREIFTENYDKLIIQQFPLFGGKAEDLILEKAEIPFDQNTEFYRGTKNGLIRINAPKVMCLSGRIKNQPNSFVFLNLTEFGIIGTILESEGKLYSISPIFSSKEGEHILTNANSQIVSENVIFRCLTEDYSGNRNEIKDLIDHYDGIPLSKKPLLEVKLITEGTADYFKIFNNLQAATAYMVSVIAQSSKLYQEFFNVRLFIGQTIVWEDDWDDPYYGTQNLQEKLRKMPSVWKSKTVDRALVVLFANLANQPQGETVAGISFGGTPYYGSLCNRDYGYCVLGIRGNARYPTLNYTWDVNVSTHEIGHNFGLPHTHNCYWQPNMIDTCVTGETYGVGDACIRSGNPIPRPGTIMSYCHLTNATRSVQLIFHPREYPLGRTAAERSSCVKQPASPYVSLLNPLGEKSYIAGDILPIRWTSARVNYLTIFFSSNNGSTWSVIADNVPVTDSIYFWETPKINTSQALIYIRDKGNPLVADTSMKPFSISVRSIQVSFPSENEEFAQNELIALSWRATLVDSFIIQFSSDGGNTFKTLESNYTNTYYEFIAPEIQSDNCLFKIISTDGKIFAQTSTFKIGVPQAEIIFPKGGEILCVGASYSIRWSASYVNKIILEYSVDNGTSWRKISLGNIDAKQRGYIWKVPNRLSNQALIRIRPNFSEMPITQNSKTFSIDSCQTVGNVEIIANSLERITNVSISSDQDEISFDVNRIEDLKNPTIAVYDLLGRLLYSEPLLNSLATPFRQTINLDLPSGNVFFLVLQFEGGSYLVSTFLLD
ncbi:MAG: zinc-dependent metalloprotease [Ignavibacteria bacterium]|nr:zinc-dependent metalloprotease [Ignavibacteria bacterium]